MVLCQLCEQKTRMRRLILSHLRKRTTKCNAFFLSPSRNVSFFFYFRGRNIIFNLIIVPLFQGTVVTILFTFFFTLIGWEITESSANYFIWFFFLFVCFKSDENVSLSTSQNSIIPVRSFGNLSQS